MSWSDGMISILRQLFSRILKKTFKKKRIFFKFTKVYPPKKGAFFFQEVRLFFKDIGKTHLSPKKRTCLKFKIVYHTLRLIWRKQQLSICFSSYGKTYDGGNFAKEAFIRSSLSDNPPPPFFSPRNFSQPVKNMLFDHFHGHFLISRPPFSKNFTGSLGFL